ICRPRFSGFDQVLSFIFDLNTSSPPNPACPSEEKYRLFPSGCINGVTSSNIVLMIGPAFCGAFQRPLLSFCVYHMSLPPNPPCLLLTKNKNLPSADKEGCESQNSELINDPKFFGLLQILPSQTLSYKSHSP